MLHRVTDLAHSVIGAKGQSPLTADKLATDFIALDLALRAGEALPAAWATRPATRPATPAATPAPRPETRPETNGRPATSRRVRATWNNQPGAQDRESVAINAVLASLRRKGTIR